MIDYFQVNNLIYSRDLPQDDRSPIDIARSYGKTEMEAFLGEYLEVMQLPIHRAIWERASSEDVVVLLRDDPSGAKRKDRNGKLPLHYAIEMRSQFEVSNLSTTYIPSSTNLLLHLNAGISTSSLH